jgi:hypothetical protein
MSSNPTSGELPSVEKHRRDPASAFAFRFARYSDGRGSKCYRLLSPVMSVTSGKSEGSFLNLLTKRATVIAM